MARVYLDHNASAPLRPEARSGMAAVLDAPAGNPSSPHREGQAARAVVDQARRWVARLIGARPREIVFTPSGTEACNLALRGSAVPALAGSRLVALAIEHPAVREPLEMLRREGFDVRLVPVGKTGRVVPRAVERALAPRTALVICMWANNGLGVIQPVEEVAGICAARGVRLFTDATQAAGRIPVDVSRVPVDLLALSAHKMGGPPGAGALFVREGTRLQPLVTGGGQEMGLHAGTENAAALAGFGAAAEAARTHRPAEARALAALRDHLVARVRQRVPGVRPVGEKSPRLPNTVQFLVPHDDEEMLILALDRAGYAVSAGSACAAGAHRRSHVLEAMGLAAPGTAAVRVSLGPGNTAAEVDGFADALAGCLAR